MLSFLLFISLRSVSQESSPVDYVNPLMGSDSNYSLSNGNTYPAIALPWGMNFWTPQTAKMGDGWVYAYDATHIQGFKQTHQPSPWINDYGQFSLFPMTGELKINGEKTGKLVFAQSRNRKTILLQRLPGRLRCNYRNHTHRTGFHLSFYFS